jgi:hypothetical protein
MHEAVLVLQFRAEVIVVILVLILLALPTVEQSLNSARGSIGRRAATGDIAGATSLFAYDGGNSTVAKSLAWVSYACLRNASTCSILIAWKGRILLARGAFPESCKQSSGNKVDVAQLQSDLGELLPETITTALPRDGLYMPSRREMAERQLSAASFVSEGIQSAYVVPFGDSNEGFMVTLSEYERSLGAKDRSWLLSLSRSVQLAYKQL